MQMSHIASIKQKTSQRGLILELDAGNYNSYPHSGTQWKDLSGKGNHGTIVGSITYVPPNIMDFDGTAGNYVDFGAVPEIGAGLDEFTIEAWIYPKYARLCLLAENGSGYTTNTFYLAIENDNEISFEMYGDGHYQSIRFLPGYSTNTWYQVVGTWASNQEVEMYINTIAHDGPISGNVIETLRDGNTNLFMGARPPAPGTTPTESLFPQLRIYDRKLELDEIINNFNADRKKYGI